MLDSVASYHGTPTGSATWNSPGPITDGLSKSANFDGATGYVTLGSGLETALMTASNWTIELWCLPLRQNGGSLFGAAASASQRVSIEHFNNTFFTSSSVGGNKSSSQLGTTTAETVWHHVVLRSDGALYVDGVAQVGVGSATLASTVAATIGVRNNALNFFQGRISHVALYTSLLSDTRIGVHFSKGVESKMLAGRNFYWDFETDFPNVFPAGSDDIVFYDQLAALSNAQAFAGTQSLSVGGGTFRSAQFNNQTNQERWAGRAEGKVRCRFRYNGTLPDTMIFQLTGKDRTGRNDTNDALSCRVTTTAVTLNHISEGGANTKSLAASISLAADTWHQLEARWRTTGSPNLSLTINGTEYTGIQTLGVMNCDAFHHLLIGNDRNSTPTGFWIDEFETFGTWDG